MRGSNNDVFCAYLFYIIILAVNATTFFGEKKLTYIKHCFESVYLCFSALQFTDKSALCASLCELIQPNVITLGMFSNVVQTTIQTLLISPKTITGTFVKISRLVEQLQNSTNTLSLVFLHTLNNKQYVKICYFFIFKQKFHCNVCQRVAIQ